MGKVRESVVRVGVARRTTTGEPSVDPASPVPCQTALVHPVSPVHLDKKPQAQHQPPAFSVDQVRTLLPPARQCVNHVGRGTTVTSAVQPPSTPVLPVTPVSTVLTLSTPLQFLVRLIMRVRLSRVSRFPVAGSVVHPHSLPPAPPHPSSTYSSSCLSLSLSPVSFS